MHLTWKAVHKYIHTVNSLKNNVDFGKISFVCYWVWIWESIISQGRWKMVKFTSFSCGNSLTQAKGKRFLIQHTQKGIRENSLYYRLKISYTFWSFRQFGICPRTGIILNWTKFIFILAVVSLFLFFFLTVSYSKKKKEKWKNQFLLFRKILVWFHYRENTYSRLTFNCSNYIKMPLNFPEL